VIGYLCDKSLKQSEVQCSMHGSVPLHDPPSSSSSADKLNIVQHTACSIVAGRLACISDKDMLSACVFT